MTAIVSGVAVLGAGPAGLAAATAAAERGVTVDLIDAGPQAGGQYWMQSAPALHAAPSAQQAEGRAAIDAARRAGVRFHLGAEIWAIFPDLSICATSAGASIEVRPAALVIATGAHDRVPPFPGWTLPGVMTAGAAQRLAKLGGVPAGKRVVVAGSGPFLLVVANAVHGAGATVAAYIEARRPPLRLLPHLARHPGRWSETLRLLRGVAAASALSRTGWIVTEALGADRVEAVRIAPIDRRGRIDRTRAQTIADVDALVVGFGFRPAIELTSLLRCVHGHDEAAGGWYCDVDAVGATTVPHVYAAGEVTGVAGALPARLAGRIAGLAAAADASGDASASSAEMHALGERLRRARAFVTPLNRAFEPPAAIDDLARADTIVCRCEEVTHGDVVAALRDGATSVSGAKLWTRAGMGRCQGRMCGWGIARLATHGHPEAAGINHPRIPIRPVALSAVAATLESTGEPS